MRLKIAILGTRGIPNNYGGFEHIAACLGEGLVAKGHEVTVYNGHRHPFKDKQWKGINIVRCYEGGKIIGMAGQFVYDLNCVIDAGKGNFDIILILGYTSISIWGPLFPGKPIVITNMDGLEWMRSKYSRPVKIFLKYAERLGIKYSDFYIADSPVIKKYLDNKYNIGSKYIGYGATLDYYGSEEVLREYGVMKNEYFLLMARMEPENNIEMILEGYCHFHFTKKFIVIGNIGNSYGRNISKKFRSNTNILFVGAVFNPQTVASLRASCTLYFHGHSVGGTNPSLLDAMAARVPIAAHDNAFNRSLLQDNSTYFSNSNQVFKLLSTQNEQNSKAQENNFRTVTNNFTWDKITEQYENYFIECINSKKK